MFARGPLRRPPAYLVALPRLHRVRGVTEAGGLPRPRQQNATGKALKLALSLRQGARLHPRDIRDRDRPSSTVTAGLTASPRNSPNWLPASESSTSSSSSSASYAAASPTCATPSPPRRRRRPAQSSTALEDREGAPRRDSGWLTSPKRRTGPPRIHPHPPEPPTASAGRRRTPHAAPRPRQCRRHISRHKTL